MSSTSISRHINAPRALVYRTLLDARAIAQWKVPDGMTCQVHAFDAREGGAIRISLTYDEPTGTGKTTARTDTYHGRFVKLVSNEQIVEEARPVGCGILADAVAQCRATGRCNVAWSTVGKDFPPCLLSLRSLPPLWSAILAR
ncbi:MAG: SRPBCC domain-containing protein [Thermomicrobia bacterium]|nr:SRPBCC domain-containing protein [Thermomicrobia bacterium]